MERLTIEEAKQFISCDDDFASEGIENAKYFTLTPSSDGWESVTYFTAKKKGRGRPKKNKTKIEVSDSDEDEQPKKRGRKKKVKKDISTMDDDTLLCLLLE